MRIINIENKTNNKYNDAIDLILDDSFLTPACDDEEIMLYYGQGNSDKIDFQLLLQEIKKRMSNLDVESKEYKTLSLFCESRDEFNFSMMLREKYDLTFSREQFENILKILTDQTIRAQFIDFENNKKFFYCRFPNGTIQKSSGTQAGYMKILARMFGKADRNGNLSGISQFESYYIPDLQKYIEGYLQLYEKLNFKKYTPKDCRFDESLLQGNFINIVRDDEITEWDLNPELKNEIYKGMPSDLTPEEKAMWIYCKMCIIFLYDEGYIYRNINILDKENYHSTLNMDDAKRTEHLESIKPGDKITCFDFVEIYCKCIGDMNAELDWAIITEGINSGHYFTGIASSNGSIALEAVNGIEDSDGNTSNDLLRAKLGVELKGIRFLDDPNGIMRQAYEKIYPMVLKSKVESETETIMKQIKLLPPEKLPLEEYLRVFLDNLIRNMNERKITGNEFTLLLNNIIHKGFESEIKKVYLGKIERAEDGKFHIKRKIFLYIKGSESGYLIDTNSSLQNNNGGLSVEKIRISELKKLLANEELILERDDKAIQ